MMPTQATRIWLATAPVDMRKGFDSLAEHVRVFLGGDPLCGDLFVFRSKRGRSLKLLWWDRNGLIIYYKRLEKGTFPLLRRGDTSAELTPSELLELLSGSTQVQ